MPKNTLKFWKNLRREKLNNTNCLGSLRFAIFGLGDSSYQKCVLCQPLRCSGAISTARESK
jgi:sulfite reductase alpha subunit-like flavoprotein